MGSLEESVDVSDGTLVVDTFTDYPIDINPEYYGGSKGTYGFIFNPVSLTENFPIEFILSNSTGLEKTFTYGSDMYYGKVQINSVTTERVEERIYYDDLTVYSDVVDYYITINYEADEGSTLDLYFDAGYFTADGGTETFVYTESIESSETEISNSQRILIASFITHDSDNDQYYDVSPYVFQDNPQGSL